MKKVGLTFGNMIDWIINRNKFRTRTGSFYRMMRLQYIHRRRFDSGRLSYHYMEFIRSRVCPLPKKEKK